MTITEFLLDRISEDECLANEAVSDFDREGGSVALDGLAARTVAECAAKRAIVELHIPWGFEYSGGEGCTRCVSPDNWTTAELPDDERFPCQTLRLLASAYADHPDFREEWRP